jgi:uncharacterized membrane protein
MPRHDPVPRPRTAERAANRARFRRIMGWMALAAVVSVLLALIWLKSFGDPLPIHAQIATILGVGLTVLVGTGLMTLVFLSSRSGHDEDAARGARNDEDETNP